MEYITNKKVYFLAQGVLRRRQQSEQSIYRQILYKKQKQERKTINLCPTW